MTGRRVVLIPANYKGDNAGGLDIDLCRNRQHSTARVLGVRRGGVRRGGGDDYGFDDAEQFARFLLNLVYSGR